MTGAAGPAAQALLELLESLDVEMTPCLRDALQTIITFSVERRRYLVCLECGTTVFSARLEFDAKRDVFTTDCCVQLVFGPPTTMTLKGSPSSCWDHVPAEWRRLTVLQALCTVVESLALAPTLVCELL
jgi:hypothetical protein